MAFSISDLEEALAFFALSPIDLGGALASLTFLLGILCTESRSASGGLDSPLTFPEFCPNAARKETKPVLSELMAKTFEKFADMSDLLVETFEGFADMSDLLVETFELFVGMSDLLADTFESFVRIPFRAIDNRFLNRARFEEGVFTNEAWLVFLILLTSGCWELVSNRINQKGDIPYISNQQPLA